MGQKIERDQQRFRKIVRGKVKSNLSKYISHGEMIGRKGNDLVSIPLPQIDVPQFRYGQKGSGGVGVGRGRGRPAAHAAAGRRRRAAGRRPARRPHPRSRADDGGAGRDPRRGAGAAAHRAARQEEHRHREGQVHQHPPGRPGVAAALQADLQAGPEAADRRRAPTTPSDPLVIPIREDKQYRTWKEVPQPQSGRRASST